jgi:hypothetical protein
MLALLFVIKMPPSLAGIVSSMLAQASAHSLYYSIVTAKVTEASLGSSVGIVIRVGVGV